MKMNVIDKVAYLLLVVGGLNWGLVGAFEFNLVDELFGVESAISKIVYVLVGIAALYGAYALTVALTKSEKATAAE